MARAFFFFLFRVCVLFYRQQRTQWYSKQTQVSVSDTGLHFTEDTHGFPIRPLETSLPKSVNLRPIWNNLDPRSHGHSAKRKIYIALFSPDGISHVGWHLSSPESGRNTAYHEPLCTVITQSQGNRLSALSSSLGLNWKIWFTTYWFSTMAIYYLMSSIGYRKWFENTKHLVIKMFLFSIWLFQTYNIQALHKKSC